MSIGPNLEFGVLSDQGPVRLENQDAWFADHSLGLFGVADGVGGGPAGRLASRIVAETVPRALRRQLCGIDDLGETRARMAVADCLRTVCKEFVQESLGHPAIRGLGSTLVLVVVREAKAIVAHMGDSRAYRCRAGKLKQLTRDHTIAALLVDAGELEDERSEIHPSHGSLTRFVGMSGEPMPEVGDCLVLLSGDRLLLCTDGITSALTESEILHGMMLCSSPPASCRVLVDWATQRGSRDNMTALTLFVG